MWKTVLLCVAVGGSFCRAESFLNNISRNLRSEMSGVWEMSQVNYSKPVVQADYKARLEFDMRAMGPLYNSTKIVIDVIAKKDAYPEGFVSVSDGHVEIVPLNENWRPLLAHYAGPAAVVIIAALLVVVLPLAGLFWCCCYWCRAGRRRRPFDRKYDACLKGLLAIILIALLTLFLFGVVCAFATEEQLEHSAQHAPDSFVAGVDDVRTYLNATQAHARWLLVVNFRELEKKLDALLTTSGMTVSMQLGEFSRAVSVTALNGMVQRLDGVAADLREVHRLTGALRSNAEHLNSGLRKVKARLLQTLARCEQPQCIRLQEKYKIGQLDTEIQYSQMPDVTELLSNVTALLESNIKADVAEGQKVFTDIQRAIQRSVDENIPAIQDSIHETGRRLEGVSENISAMAGNASEALKRGSAQLDAVKHAHSQYGPYRRYVGLAAATALLTITCLLAWGLMCGVCGKRPDVYGAGDCCNKAAGSKCLLCGMGVMFLVGGGAALVMLAYFVAGIAGQRFICDPLTEPVDNRLFYDVDQFLDFEKMLFDENEDPNFNITSVLTACHQNLTIYKVLHLHRLYDIEKIQLEVNGEVGRRVAALRPAFPSGARALSILKPSAKLKLRQLADTGLSDFDFDRILHALETNVTSLSLDGLSAQLESTARTLATRVGFASVAAELRDAASMLADYHTNVVRLLLADTARLNTTALKLRDGLRFNHSSLKEAVSYLMYETTQAEHFLNTQGPDVIQNMTREYAERVAAMLDEYLQHVLTAAQHDVGRCAPLSNALNVSRDAFCHKILMPTNGYWMSLAWCLLLFVPIMVVAQRLARLYLHVDPYPGPLVEAEYLYDAYADRDNVPLANAYKAEKRAGRGRGGAGGGGGSAARAAEPEPRAAAAVAPPLDAHHARRYNDMAPKHWEEGPPRYHGPTEYERPPPYYYPGPNGNNRNWSSNRINDIPCTSNDHRNRMANRPGPSGINRREDMYNRGNMNNRHDIDIPSINNRNAMNNNQGVNNRNGLIYYRNDTNKQLAMNNRKDLNNKQGMNNNHGFNNRDDMNNKQGMKNINAAGIPRTTNAMHQRMEAPPRSNPKSNNNRKNKTNEIHVPNGMALGVRIPRAHNSATKHTPQPSRRTHGPDISKLNDEVHIPRITRQFSASAVDLRSKLTPEVQKRNMHVNEFPRLVNPSANHLEHKREDMRRQGARMENENRPYIGLNRSLSMPALPRAKVKVPLPSTRPEIRITHSEALLQNNQKKLNLYVREFMGNKLCRVRVFWVIFLAILDALRWAMQGF